jgi:hypothetical protein
MMKQAPSSRSSGPGKGGGAGTSTSLSEELADSFLDVITLVGIFFVIGTSTSLSEEL